MKLDECVHRVQADRPRLGAFRQKVETTTPDLLPKFDRSLEALTVLEEVLQDLRGIKQEWLQGLLSTAEKKLATFLEFPSSSSMMDLLQSCRELDAYLRERIVFVRDDLRTRLGEFVTKLVSDPTFLGVQKVDLQQPEVRYMASYRSIRSSLESRDDEVCNRSLGAINVSIGPYLVEVEYATNELENALEQYEAIRQAIDLLTAAIEVLIRILGLIV